MNYSIKINLLKIKDASLVNLKGKESTKKCLVIPVEGSGLFVGEKGIYLDMTAFELKEISYDQTHIVKLSLDKETFNTMSDEEKNAMPILGGLKQFVKRELQPTQTVEIDNTDEDTGLPF